MELPIERARPADAAEMAAIQVRGLASSYRDLLPAELLDTTPARTRARHWRLWLERRRAYTAVARLEGSVVGFAALHPANEDATPRPAGEIAACFVDPSHWGRGIGSQLCRHLLARASADGFATLLVWVMESNEPAKRLYSSQGFVPDGSTRVLSEHSGRPLHDQRYRRSVR